MRVNEPQFLQFIPVDIHSGPVTIRIRNLLKSCSSDQGEKQNPLMWEHEQQNNINAGLVWPSKPQKQLAKRSQYRKSLSSEQGKY